MNESDRKWAMFIGTGMALIAVVNVSSWPPSGRNTDRHQTVSIPVELEPVVDDWQLVPIDGEVGALGEGYWGVEVPDVMAAGVSGTRPLLLDLEAGESRVLDYALPNRYRQGIETVDLYDGLMVTEPPGRRASAPASVWYGEEWDVDPGDAYVDKPPVDERGRPAHWLAPGFDGEGGLNAVGAIRVDGTWQVRAWSNWSRWRLADREPLYTTSSPSSQILPSGVTQTSVVVGGPLSKDRRTASAGAALWEAFTGDGDLDRWRPRPFESPIDEVTDVEAWEVGWWAAARRGVVPVVMDETGHEIPMPSTVLDPDHPVVYVATMPIGDTPLAIAVQAVDGPKLWVQESGRWAETSAPPGELTAALKIEDEVYLVIDGQVWYLHSAPTSGAAAMAISR